MRIVVLCMLALAAVCLPLLAADGPLTGTWSSIITYTDVQTLSEVLDWDMLFDVDAELSPITFGMSITSAPANHGLAAGGPYWTLRSVSSASSNWNTSSLSRSRHSPSDQS